MADEGGFDLDRAAELDRADPLARFRSRFQIPKGVVYLDGNSLGALPRITPTRIEQVVEEEWGIDLIRAWTAAGWIDLPLALGDRIGRLIGAAPGQTIVCDSTSVNLFKVLHAALHLNPERGVILSDRGNFPTDLYVAQGIAAGSGGRLRLELAEPDAVAARIGPDVAVLMLTEVDYRTGRLHDMAALTAQARAAGALTVWDLAHSAGVLPVALDAVGADFAVGCGYKYLNGGPGAPAFLYAAARHHHVLANPLAGWLGHAAPFDFAPEFRPAAGIARMLVGTPPILSMAALSVGVELAEEADPAEVRAKAMALSEFFRQGVAALLPGMFEIVSPADPARRGAQIALAHPDGWPIMQELIARGVIGDFRAPNILRFGFAPLYVGFGDVARALTILADVMTTGAWDRPERRARAKVT